MPELITGQKTPEQIQAMREGGAHVYEKHANIVIAGPGAKAGDVAKLTARMAAAVKQQFGFELEPEVRFWGEVGGVR